MTRITTLLLLLAAASCASTGAEHDPLEEWAQAAVREAAAERPDEQDDDYDEAVATPAPEVVERTPGPPAAPQRRRIGGAPTDVALDVLRDPAFRRRLIESYAAETDIEPPIGVLELEEIQEILKLIADSKRDKAIERLQKEVGEETSAVFDFTLGTLRYEDERTEEAATAYRAAVAKFPKFRRAWQNLGLILVNDGAFEEARGALTRVIELGGGNAGTYGALGFAYSNLGNYVAAESAYRMANLLEPSELNWRMGLLESYFKQARYSEAAALCDVLIAENPDSPRFWTIQANAYVGLGKTLEAAENFELVDRLGGATPASLNLLGDIYVNQTAYDLAARSYARAIGADTSGDPARPIRAARDLTMRNALPQAELLLGRIEELMGERLDQEQTQEVLRLRARIAMVEGATEREVAILEELVALDPLDGDALILLGRHASGEEGGVARAIYYFERAAELDEFEGRAKIAHGQLLVSERKYREALPLLRRAYDLDRRDNLREYIEHIERYAARSVDS